MDDQNNQQKPLILLADDDSTFRMIARRAFETVGFQCIDVEHGLLALNAFEELQPQVVMLDIMMPEMDGYETCKTIRTLPRGEYLPIIMMTSSDNEESINKAFEAGATDFVTKPVNWQILGHRLHFIMRTNQRLNSVIQSELKTLFSLYTFEEHEADDITAPIYTRIEWLKHLHTLENIIGSDTFRYAIVSFLFEAPRLIKKLEESLEESDFTSFHEHTSVLRSSAANVGAKKMVLLCKELDMTIKVHYVETVKRIIKELQQEFIHVKEFLDSEFKLKSNETIKTNP